MTVQSSRFSIWLTHFSNNGTNPSLVVWLWVPASLYAWPANTNRHSLYVHMCPLTIILWVKPESKKLLELLLSKTLNVMGTLNIQNMDFLYKCLIISEKQFKLHKFCSGCGMRNIGEIYFNHSAHFRRQKCNNFNERHWFASTKKKQTEKTLPSSVTITNRNTHETLKKTVIIQRVWCCFEVLYELLQYRLQCHVP
jgi:hypothetical protein